MQVTHAASTENLAYRYRNGTELRFPDWSAETGSRWMVAGPSGSGKTTLLHLLAGLRPASRGRVQVGDIRLEQLTETARDAFRGRHIGIVFQTFHLLPTLSVLRNLLLAPYMAGLRPDRGRALALLERLELAEYADHYPDHLSQGQAQRVALARAVMNRPPLLLADEPTSALDDAACELLLETLGQEADDCGATLVIATHDHRVAHRVDRLLELPA